MCIQAELTGRLELLSQANVNRKRAKEKLTVVEELDKNLEAKLEPLKKAKILQSNFCHLVTIL